MADWLAPGGALQGPLFAGLLERLTRPARDLQPGERVGPYRVLGPLGRGGMAVVYLAERADGEFVQNVALKVITSDHRSPVARELLRRERQILAALDHPHIARLLDGGTTDEGVVWFAMEPVQGTPIDRFCRDRGLSLTERLRLVLQVCAAVQFAHARSLIHRDLKPSNILVTDDGASKLLDFGIAIAAAPTAERPAPALTPGFASPEQRRGDVITTASDVWQLGNLLALLTRDPAPRRRHRADLAAIVACATHAEPVARYGRPGELAADLTRLIERRPVVARRGGPLYRAARLVARHRRSSAALALIVTAALAMAIQLTVRLARERDAAAREAERANAAVGFVVDVFRSGDPSVSRGQAIDAEALLARGSNRLETELSGQPALRVLLLQTIGRIQLALGEPMRARPLFDQAIALLRAAPDGGRGSLPEALAGRGAALLGVGDPVAALGALTESAALLTGETSAIRRRRRATLDLLSMAQLGGGRIEAALATQRAAVAIAEAEHGAGSLEAAESLQNLGIVLRASAPPRSAAPFERAWRIYDAAYGADHPATAGAQKLYALALLDAHRLDDAAPMLEQSAEVHRRIFHGKGQAYATAVRALGKLSAARGNHRRAIAYYLQSEALSRDAVDPESITMSWTLAMLGDSYEALGEHAAALDAYQHTLAIRERLLPPDHPNIAAALEGCSRQLVQLHRGAEAEVLARRARAIRAAR